MGVSATSRQDAPPPPDERLRALMSEAAAHARRERARNLGLGLIALILIAVTSRATQFAPDQFIGRLPNMGRILAGFLHPDVSIVKPGSSGFAEGLIGHYMLQTLEIAILGTFIGAAVAIPLSFLGAGNLMRRNPLGSALYLLTRLLMSVIRAVPTLFWGILFVTAVGLGASAGILAVAIFSAGLMSKLFSEAIEAIDPGQVEAVTATGANQLQTLARGVMPQVLPYLIANLLYTFEVNVHSATILGVVGAGGIGYLFLEYIELFSYQQEAMILIVVILTTMVIDYSSATIRRRII